MSWLTGRLSVGAKRRGWAPILVAMIAVWMMALASSAQAGPNVASAWGANGKGQLGDGTSAGPEQCGPSLSACSTTPGVVSNLSGITAISAGGGEAESFGFGLALLENGTVAAWGRNENKELGDGSTEQRDVPVAVSGLSEVAAISAGPGEHSLALLKNGTVMSWGRTIFFGSPHGPEAVSGVSGATGVAAGRFWSMALLSNGTVMTWGGGGSGQLGDGSNESSETPVTVCAVGTVGSCPTGPYLEGVKSIAASGEYALALLENGTVVAWGNNRSGQLGNGSTTNTDVPVAVSGLSGVKAIAVGGSHSLALLNDGTVKAWGSNLNGQLGDGSHTGPETCGETSLPCSRTPVAVTGLSGVSAISGGASHSLALLSNGAVEAWGANGSGQLGVGTSTGPEPCGPFAEPCSTTPVAVKQGAVVKGIAASGAFSLAFSPKPPPANLPEVGRCVKVAAGSGKYSNSACTTVATKPAAKKYEWKPPSTLEPLAFSGSGGEPTFTTTGHTTIKCVNANFSGEWTGAKAASVNVEFQACTNPQGQQCQSTAQPQFKGEIKLRGVVGELGFITYEEVEGKLIVAVGLDLKPPPAPPGTRQQLAAYECTGSSELAHLEGSVISKITPINKMTTEQKLLYFATRAGEQRPEYFQGAPKDTLTTTFTSGLEEEVKGSGGSALSMKQYVGHNAAPLEIKAK